MTKRRNDSHSTEYGLWLRDEPSIDSSLGYVATNIDYIWRNYKTGEGKPIQESLNNAYDFCLKNNISDFAKYYEMTEHKRKRFNTIMIFPNNVCSTITSTCEHVIANEKRFINKVELLKASTFPQDYNFLNVKEDYLCGMSVPPVMTAQIATRIKKYIFDKIQEGKK